MDKKTQQLEVNFGTAANRLKKVIMLDLLKQLNKNICFQCKKEIETVEELSIEHKVPWLDSDRPKELFFNLDNIAFSHLTCNIRAARQTKIPKHPSINFYMKGCRCDGCKAINYSYCLKRRARLKNAQ